MPQLRHALEFDQSLPVPLTLIATFDVAQGTVVTASMGPTRTEEDSGAHITRTVASDDEATRWSFVLDHLNIHQSESVVHFVAEHDGITDFSHRAPRCDSLPQSHYWKKAMLLREVGL